MLTNANGLYLEVSPAGHFHAGFKASLMDLSMSDAVRLFLRRVVVDQAFPLELKVPNSETQAVIAESRMMLSKRKARFAAADASRLSLFT